MKKINLLSISIHTGKYIDFVKQILEAAEHKESMYTCIANVHMLIEAYRDNQFSRVVRNADFITPDGKPLSWAARLLYGIKQERVAGMDLLPDLLQGSVERNLGVYFYGGTPELMNETRDFMQLQYPFLRVAGYYSPPFRKLSAEEEKSIVDEINTSGAHLVFIVLGCPKQEKWAASMRGRIHAMMVAVGGALPVMIGKKKRAPRWMQQSGLEWLYRLTQEPNRLFKRYFVTNSLFIYLLIKEYLKLNLFKASSLVPVAMMLISALVF